MARRKKSLAKRIQTAFAKRQKAFRKRQKSAVRTANRVKRIASRKYRQAKVKAFRFGKRKNKAAAKVAKRTTKKIRRQFNATAKATRRYSKRLGRESRRVQKATVKAVKRNRKRLRSVFKATTRAYATFKKTRARRGREQKKQAAQQRRELRAVETAKRQIDLTGQADITGAVIRKASVDPGASKPGEPPKMRTGKGRSAIKAQLRMSGKKLNSRVYVDKKIAGYMAMWEFRKDGKGRPWLKPSVENNKEKFGAIIGSELKQGNRGGKRKAVVK